MTDGTSQGLFVVIAIVIFGIFVGLAYTVFGDVLQPKMVNLFETALNIDIDAGGSEGAPIDPAPETPVDPEHIVVFEDANLEKLVKERLGLSTAEPVKVNKMQSMTILRADDTFIKSLSGLEYATNLNYLKITVDESTDLTPLSKLTKLTTIDTYGSKLTDYKPLEGLKQLESLRIGSTLDESKITDINFLKNLTNLTSIDLFNNKINNIEPLKNLTNLKSLNLSQNEILDITSLTNLTKLTELYLSTNSIENLEPLTKLINLTKLNLSTNSIANLEPLTNLTNLTNLNLFRNNITNVEALSKLINLKELDISYNKQLTDITPVKFVPKLTK